jgi:hypothetical protein
MKLKKLLWCALFIMAFSMLALASTPLSQLASFDNIAAEGWIDERATGYMRQAPSSALPWSDGFESGDFTAGGWTIQDPNATVTTAAKYTGTYGAKLAGTTWIQKIKSTEDYNAIHVKYRRATTGFDSGENLYVEWSVDGSTWNNLETVRTASYSDGLQDKICAAGADNNANFRIRFRTNANTPATEYAYIDDVEITGTSTDEVYEGTGSMRIAFTDFADPNFDIEPKLSFDPALDLSDYQHLGITLWLWTDVVNDSKLWEIILYDDAGNVGRFAVPTPESSGWSKVTAPLRSFVWDNEVPPEDVHWDSITTIGLSASCYEVPGNDLYFDDMWLEIVTISPVPPYQIATFDDIATEGWYDDRGTGYMLQSGPPSLSWSDGFESGNFTAGDWTTQNGYATVTTTAKYTGYFGARLEQTTWIQKIKSTEDYNAIHVKYDRRTTSTSLTLVVDWSTDGSTWNTLETTTSTSWASKDYTLDPNANNNAGFRIRFRTTSSVNNKYAYVDNVQITGTSTSEGTGTMQIAFTNFNGTDYDIEPDLALDPALDFSDYRNLAITLWVWTDPDFENENISYLSEIILYDGSGNIGRFAVPLAQNPGWQKVTANLDDFMWKDTNEDPLASPDADWSSITTIGLWVSCWNGDFATPPYPDIYMDDMQLDNAQKVVLSDARIVNADFGTITVDGNPADWAALDDSDVVDFNLAGLPIHTHGGNLHVKYRMAWDNDYLYILIEEQPGDGEREEALQIGDPETEWSMDDGMGGDVYFDELALYFDFTNNRRPGTDTAISLWLFLGLASQGQTDLMMAWTNGGWGPHKPEAVANGQYAETGTGLGNRVVEAKVKWSDLDNAIDAWRLPEGGLAAAIKPGYIFGCDPRLNDLEYNWNETDEAGSAWLNGNLWEGQPSGRDIFSTDVRLVCSPADLNGDCKVNFEDYAQFAEEWSSSGCNNVNSFCNGADIVIDGTVDTVDLAKLAQEWLSE